MSVSIILEQFYKLYWIIFFRVSKSNIDILKDENFHLHSMEQFLDSVRLLEKLPRNLLLTLFMILKRNLNSIHLKMESSEIYSLKEEYSHSPSHNSSLNCTVWKESAGQQHYIRLRLSFRWRSTFSLGNLYDHIQAWLTSQRSEE